MPTILIADEGDLFVALETSPVLRIGCRLVSIRSAKELPTQAATVSPDLILLDADYLRTGLREGLRALKSDRKLRSVPIVIAATDAESCREWVAADDLVFSKPVSPEDVVGALALRGSGSSLLSAPTTSSGDTGFENTRSSAEGEC